MALYIVIQKSENFLYKKNVKIIKRARAHASKGYANSHKFDILNSFNPELQLKDTKPAIKRKLIELLTQAKGYEFVVTLVSVLKKIENQDILKYNTFYLHSEVETIINKSEINNAFESVYTAIILNMQKSLGKGSGSHRE